MGKKGKGRVAVVTVHGTGDTAPGPEGDKWFQVGSAFSDRLLKRLAAAGVEAEIVPHLWSGANSAMAREEGALRLNRLMTKMSKTHDAIHLVGHSHGGNVANDAARMWSYAERLGGMVRRLYLGLYRPKFAAVSVTTVGTPFLKRGASFMQWLAALIFLGLAWAAAMILWSRASDLATWALDAPGEVRDLLTESPMLGLGFVAVGAAYVFMAPIAGQGAVRVMMSRQRPDEQRSVFAIWHPNDEAISFLQRVEDVKIEPFARGSFWRGSRTMGIVVGVWCVFAATVLGLLVLAALAAGFVLPEFLDKAFNIDSGQNVSFSDVLTQGADFLGDMVMYSPLIFLGGYIATRLLGGLGMEYGVRGGMNGFIGGALRSMALGKDGDQRLGEVSTHSHSLATVPHILEGEVAARMQAGAAEAANRLLDKYRWALFSVGSKGATSEGNAVNDLAADAMTWDSLIHTTYFDQPEVVDLIADRIISESRSAG